MKKILKKEVILSFVLGVALTSGIVYAATAANQIGYTTNNNIEIKNVEQALNDLYEKINDNVKCVKGNYSKPQNSSVNIELDFTPSFVFIYFYNYYSSQIQCVVYDSNKSVNYRLSTSNNTIDTSGIIVEENNINYEFDSNGNNYKKANTFYYIAVE